MSNPNNRDTTTSARASATTHSENVGQQIRRSFVIQKIRQLAHRHPAHRVEFNEAVEAYLAFLPAGYREAAL